MNSGRYTIRFTVGKKTNLCVSFLLVSSVFGSEETSWDLSDQVTPKEGRIYQSDSSLGPIKFWLLFTVAVDIFVLSFHNRLSCRHFFTPVSVLLDVIWTMATPKLHRMPNEIRKPAGDGNKKKFVEMIPLANLAS